jgi:DnaJ-class molecular chaperone
MAWEYNNDALITLCASCHKEEHLKNQIPVYNEKGEFQHYAENCPKCSGAGVLSEYSYYMNGVCFQCMGTGNINF